MNTYAAFAASALLLIASPGPVVALVLADGRRGWPLGTLAGGMLSALLLMGLALLALDRALALSPQLIDLGQLLGGLYLAALGITTLRSPPAAQRAQQAPARRFWRALGVGLSNPKDILFFLAFLPAFIRPEQAFAGQAVALALIWAALDFSVLLAYSLAARRLGRSARLAALLGMLPAWVLLGLGLLSFAGAALKLFNGAG